MNTKLSIIIIYILNVFAWGGIGFICWSFIPDLQKANSTLDKISKDLEKYDSLDFNLQLDSSDMEIIIKNLKDSNNKNVLITNPTPIQRQIRKEEGYKGIMFVHSGISASMNEWADFTTSINDKLSDGYNINLTIGMNNPLDFILQDIEGKNGTINQMRENKTNTHIFFLQKDDAFKNAFTVGLYNIDKKVFTISNIAMPWKKEQLSWLTKNDRNISNIPRDSEHIYLFNLMRLISRQISPSTDNGDFMLYFPELHSDVEVIMLPRFTDPNRKNAYDTLLDSLQNRKQIHINSIKESLEYLKHKYLETEFKPNISL